MKGTEKQIEWATQIKSQIESTDAIKKAIDACGDMPKEQKAAIKKFWKECETSKNFIDARIYFVHPGSYATINKGLAKKLCLYTLLEAGIAPEKMRAMI